jgi:hypothetical protein
MNDEPEIDKDDLLWEDVPREGGLRDVIVFRGPKHKLEGWLMQGSLNSWVARTMAGERAEFDNEDDARSFLTLLTAVKKPMEK